MIKINNISTNKNVSSSKGSKSASGSSFSSYLTYGVNKENNSISGASQVNVANAVFAAQMVGSEEEREVNKKVIKRGMTLLEKLEEIRNGLLLGYISKEKIIDISRFIRERKLNAYDDVLKNIISEIELRIEVELAKLTK